MTRNCQRAGFNNWTPPATKTGEKQEPRPKDACDLKQLNILSNTSYDLYHPYKNCRDRKDLKERGLDIQKASNHDGEIHASLNWHKIGDSAQ
mgnify:CR=1 FL=1